MILQNIILLMSNKYNYYRSNDNSHKRNSKIDEKHTRFRDQIANTSPGILFFSKSRQKLNNSREKQIIASQKERLRTLQNIKKQQLSIFQRQFKSNIPAKNWKIQPYQTQIIRNKFKQIELVKVPKKKGLNVISTSKIVKKHYQAFPQYSQTNLPSYKNKKIQTINNNSSIIPSQNVLSKSDLKYLTPQKMRKSCDQLFRSNSQQSQEIIESDSHYQIFKPRSNYKQSQHLYLSSMKGKQVNRQSRAENYINIEDNSESIKKADRSIEFDQNPQSLQKNSRSRSPHIKLTESKYMSPWIQELDQRLHDQSRLNNKMPFRLRYQQKCGRQKFDRLIQQNYLALRTLSITQIDAIFEQLKQSQPIYQWRSKIVKYVYSKLKRLHQYQKLRKSIKK